MTAEVAILNRNGIALAADSAVTVGGQKIYNSALKLFSLSKVEPVAIMVYGNALLLDAPWETIIKVYRDRLKQKKFATVEEQAKDFISFVARQRVFTRKESQERWVYVRAANVAVNNILRTIEQHTKDLIGKSGPISASDARKVAAHTVAVYYRAYRARSLLAVFDRRIESQLYKKQKSLLFKVVDENFGIFKFGTNTKRQIAQVLLWSFTRYAFGKDEDWSGVVIAGFGRSEIYPSIETYQVAGVIGDKLIYRRYKDKCHAIDGANIACVIPFAQEDMVRTFITGMNSQVSQFIESYIQRVSERLRDLLPDAALAGGVAGKTKFKNKFSGEAKKLLDGFMQGITSHREKDHIHPVMSMVNVLPKDELAVLAESLVNITAIKRRMTNTLETVGGPIDVLVISKGDGLVWVKRKLYFPANLNHPFFANYLRGIDHV